MKKDHPLYKPAFYFVNIMPLCFVYCMAFIYSIVCSLIWLCIIDGGFTFVWLEFAEFSKDYWNHKEYFE